MAVLFKPSSLLEGSPARMRPQRTNVSYLYDAMNHPVPASIWRGRQRRCYHLAGPSSTVPPHISMENVLGSPLFFVVLGEGVIILLLFGVVLYQCCAAHGRRKTQPMMYAPEPHEDDFNSKGNVLVVPVKGKRSSYVLSQVPRMTPSRDIWQAVVPSGCKTRRLSPPRVQLVHPDPDPHS